MRRRYRVTVETTDGAGVEFRGEFPATGISEEMENDDGFIRRFVAAVEVSAIPKRVVIEEVEA